MDLPKFEEDSEVKDYGKVSKEIETWKQSILTSGGGKFAGLGSADNKAV